MTTAKFEFDSYITEHGAPGSVLAGDPRAISSLFHYIPGTKYIPKGWTKVGTSVIEFTSANEHEIVTAKVAALRAQQQETRAEAEMKCRVWDEQIGKLLAITSEVTA